MSLLNQGLFVNVVQILDSTISTDTSSGSLLVSGGIGVQGTCNFTNIKTIGASISNLITNNLNTLTTATIPNLIVSNLSVGSIITTNLVSLANLTNTNITVSNLLSNNLTIDCRNSQIIPGQILFKNTNTGDFKLYDDGGDIQLQGGGGRSVQLGSYHEIRLTGGKTSILPITYINGSNSTFNTIIQNTNDSIGLTVQANLIQNSDLTQWTSNTGSIYCKIDKIGKLTINNTDINSIITLGGISTNKVVNIGGKINSSNVSSGSIIVDGGGGFNGDIYAQNIYTNNSKLTVSPLNTKGDIYTYATSGNVLPVGFNNQILSCDSSSNNGLKWKGTNVYDANSNPQISSYLNLVKITDQILSTTASVITFPTELWIDHNTFIMSQDHSYFYIKNPGNYMVIAKMTGYNNTYTSSTTVRWDVFSDYTLSGVSSNFSSEIGSEIYTTHTNGIGADTATFGFAWTVPIGGVYVQVQAKIISGSSSILVDGGSCTLNVFYVPGNQIIDTWNPNWIVLSPPSSNIPVYTSLSMTNIYLQNSIYPFVAPNSAFTTTVTGDYLICAKLTFQKTSGVDLTSASLRLIDQSGAIFPGCLIGSSYLTSDSQNIVTVFWCGIIRMIANTTSITLQGFIGTGSNVNMKGGFLLMLIPNSFTNQIDYSISSTSANILSSTFIDIPLQTTLATTGNASYMPSTGVVTVNNSGMYLIQSSINCLNSNNIANRTIFGQIQSSYDNGLTWFIIPGSSSSRSIGMRSGIITTNLFQCTSGTKFKLQIKTDGSTGDNITIGTGCNLSIFSPENIVTFVDIPVIYGSFYQYSYSSEILFITTIIPTEILRLSTIYMPSSLYKVSITGTVNMLNTSATSTFQLLLVNPNATQNSIFSKNIVYPRKGSDINTYNTDISLTISFIIPFQLGISQLIIQSGCTIINGSNIQNLLLDLVRVI